MMNMALKKCLMNKFSHYKWYDKGSSILARSDLKDCDLSV